MRGGDAGVLVRFGAEWRLGPWPAPSSGAQSHHGRITRMATTDRTRGAQPCGMVTPGCAAATEGAGYSET
jgi:hypothetical protein